MHLLKNFKKLLLLLLLVVTGLVIYFSAATAVTNNLDTYVYELPYKPGNKYAVVQGYGGRFSHTNKAALDFGMPEGTAVHAARDGSVYSFKDNSNEGGPFWKYEKKANYLIILHEDGSFGCYWHLQKNGVLIKKGKVKKGELIAYSGATGFVLRPHLHFAVKLKLNYQKDSFIKTRFRTTQGIVLLEPRKTYQKPLSPL